METLRAVTIGTGSNATVTYKEFHFHLHHVQYMTVEPVTLYFDENESEDPIEANELDEDGNDEDRTIELHFKDGSIVEIVYNESIYRKLKQYFNA